MLDIDRYDEWSADCDDDDLIQKLYDEGVRPGTQEYVNSLGLKCRIPTQKDSIEGNIILVTGMAVTFGVIYGSVKLIKFACGKVTKYVSTKTTKKEKSL